MEVEACCFEEEVDVGGEGLLAGPILGISDLRLKRVGAD